MVAETLKWIGDIDGCLELIDQRKLPGSFEKLRCRTKEKLYEAIKTLAVRGAPAIGVAAGFGICLAMQQVPENATLADALSDLDESADYLASSRPTAVNLFWALDRMKKCAHEFVSTNTDASVTNLQGHLLAEAQRICEEDKQMCKAIGRNGCRYIENGFNVLTHCNAGALATAGQGTALSVIYEAHQSGKKIHVYVDETRPLLQGARLTAWELTQAGIDATLICDNMAGFLFKQGKINVVITGADRIAANGDTANKIGTLGLSLLAKEHRVPFYIAAPSSTFDLNIKTGAEIPIEERNSEEILSFADMKIAPEGVRVYNPAFDVTDAAHITAIITEKGVIEKPNADKVAAHFAC
jgi:methylthioribose-1-phosphate isomerase